MGEQFNPYLEWLGIRSDERPNHYRLLGLEPFEDDPRVIANAGDGTIARVRSFRPGEHARQWKELLDELEEAKRCLLDRGRKAAYDDQLRGQFDQARPAAQPARGSALQQINPAQMHRWPPGMGPQPATAQTVSDAPANREASPQAAAPSETTSRDGVESVAASAPASGPHHPATAPSAVQPQHGHPAQPQQPSGQSPWGQAAAGPTAYPQPALPPTANSAPQPSSPQPYGAAPTTPYAYTHPPAPLAPPSSAPAPDVKAAIPMPAPGASSSAPNAHAPTAAPAGGPIDPMAPVANPVVSPTSPAPMAMPYPGAQPAPAAVPYGSVQPAAPPASAPASASPAPAPAMGSPVAAPASGGAGPSPSVSAPETSKSYREARRKSSALSTIAGLVAAGILLAGATALFVHGLSASSEEKPNGEAVAAADDDEAPIEPESSPAAAKEDPEPQPKIEKPKEEPRPEPAPKVKPTPDPKPKPKPEPKTKEPKPKPKPEATPEQIAKVQAELTETLEWLRDRDVEEARAHLAAARKAAQGRELKTQVDQVTVLVQGVDEFWNAVRAALEQLKAGEELVIGSTRIAVIEANRERISFRMLGQTRRVPVRSMPSGLARMMAQRQFDRSNAANKVFIGAFLLVDRNGKLEEVRQLWQQALAGGAEIEFLMPVLESEMIREFRGTGENE